MQFASTAFLVLSLLGVVLAGFKADSKTNLAVYWGQNSAGGHGGKDQGRLSTYCDDDNGIDIILIAFMLAMNSPAGQPVFNFANQQIHCDQSRLPITCSQIEEDIKKCQEKGKTVLLSLGGGGSLEPGYTDEATAKAGAEKVWQMFGPPDPSKSDIPRPFGSAVVDGFDFDFEKDVQNIIAFGKGLREDIEKEKGKKKFYLSAAPQCPMIGPELDLINAIQLDMVFVQFYNNPQCDVDGEFNFDKWNDWATKKNTPFFVGLPAKASAAPSGGYVGPEKLGDVLKRTEKLDHMGGAMLWDVSQAWDNDNYHQTVKKFLPQGVPKLARGLRYNGRVGAPRG